MDLVTAKRGEVFWVSPDPTGGEAQGPWPGLVVSPDELNKHLHTVVVVPITTKGKPSACRPSIMLNGKQGFAMVDQVRTVNKVRLVEHMATLTTGQLGAILRVAVEMLKP